mmetsp:Transcript_60045/g.168297  ORF Transcript_60045/g.168297 Transcript_60045/m.168297 type:complete len:316 (+) Transcript_60045:377-1324(+)
MPAPRASNTDSATPSRSGSIDATRPKSRKFFRHPSNFVSVVISSSSGSKGNSFMQTHAMAKTRKALLEYSSTTLRMRFLSVSETWATLPSLSNFSVQYSRMKFGAPLQTATSFAPASNFMPPGQSSCLPDMSVTVSIIFREDEKGTSMTRWLSEAALPSSKPTFRAATMIGASDELPLGSHLISPLSGSTTLLMVVLQQSTAAYKAERTEISLPASLPWAFLMPPKVGSKPLPVTSYDTPPAHMFTIVILPSVNVPVLSLQITDAEPNVSTAANLRTSTFFSTIWLQPMDSAIVTQSGMPSGMAATASVTDTRIM